MWVATANSEVKFVYTTSTSYIALATKDENTLYFLSDTREVFLGTQNYAPAEHWAGDSVAGVIKTDSTSGISLDANGKLDIDGRLGAFPDSLGTYLPDDREPRAVGDYSLLITDALGINMSTNRSLAIVSGFGINVNSAAPGTTIYYAKNTYINRIIAKVCEDGFVSRDEATSKQEQIIPVTSVKIAGQTFTPDSSPDNATDLIQITLAETANPDTTITKLRMFGSIGSYASAHIGNGIRSVSGGRSLILGGGITKVGGGNDICAVGQNMYAAGNGNALFGRNHIAVKNRGFFAGTGHDSTNARSESASAVGEYSFMDSNTLFAVGNGVNPTTRSNAFEVTVDGGIVLRSPDGSRWKITIDNSGNWSSSNIT